MEDKKNKIECNVYNLRGVIYIIKTEDVDLFDSTPEYEKENKFSNYILPDEAVVECVLIDILEYENIVDGWF